MQLLFYSKIFNQIETEREMMASTGPNSHRRERGRRTEALRDTEGTWGALWSPDKASLLGAQGKWT